MQKNVKHILLVVIAVFVSACATAPGPKFSGLVPAAEGHGDLYLYRTGALFASAQSFDVSIDGSKVGEIFNASFLHLKLTPGHHTVKVWPRGLARSSELQIQVEPTKSIFLQYDFHTGPVANAFFIGSSIQPRSQEQALADMKELNSTK